MTRRSRLPVRLTRLSWLALSGGLTLSSWLTLWPTGRRHRAATGRTRSDRRLLRRTGHRWPPELVDGLGDAAGAALVTVTVTTGWALVGAELVGTEVLCAEPLAFAELLG